LRTHAAKTIYGSLALIAGSILAAGANPIDATLAIREVSTITALARHYEIFPILLAGLGCSMSA
jgi:hypothetical protein